MKNYVSASEMISHVEIMLNALKQLTKDDFHSYHTTSDGKTFIIAITDEDPAAIVFNPNGGMTLQYVSELKGPFTFVGVQKRVA